MPLLPLSLFASTGWWAAALQSEGRLKLFTGVPKSGIWVYNRYSIVTANGVQQLSIPLKGGRKQRLPLRELRIDYTHDWQRQHWGALYSAYGRAPFFEHFGPALEGIIQTGYERLEELNRAAFDWICKELRLSLLILEEETGRPDESADATKLPAYHQVFQDRWGFQPGLSILDLMMNEGPFAASLLKGI